MQNQRIKPLWQSKYVRKTSISSQMRNSALSDNLKVLESSRLNNYPQFQNVFNADTGQLESLYLQTIKKCPTKPIMHVGLILELGQLIHFLKQLATESGHTFRTINKINERKELLEGIVFAPFWFYKIQNCSIIFWILQSSAVTQASSSPKADRLIQIFASYPQLIITEFSTYEILKSMRINLPTHLKFQQQFLILSNKAQHVSSSFTFNAQGSSQKMYFTDFLDKNIFRDYLTLTLKRNSLRCYHQHLRINLYILNSLSWVKIDQDRWEFLCVSLQNINDIFDHAARNYLSFQVEKKYQILIENLKNSPPRNEKELENEISLNEQELLREVKKNIKILNQVELVKSSVEATEKKLSANHQQILLNNKEATKKQNYQILGQLYEKLLNKFDKGRYSASKERAAFMAEDIQAFMEQYERKAVHSSTLFSVFNTFMKNNRAKYYEKVEALQDQIDQNKKNQNFEDIFDPIEMKKKVLFTLQKQVKQLELKKLQYESQNQRLKKLQRRIELGGRMDTEGQDLYEEESTKTMKAKAVSPRMKNFSSIRSYPKVEKIDEKKKKCFNCCKCSIF